MMTQGDDEHHGNGDVLDKALDLDASHSLVLARLSAPLLPRRRRPPS